jgi:hypothetical protein
VAEGEPVTTVGPGVGDDVGYAVGDCQATANRSQLLGFTS